MKKRGISPLVATVILIAIVVVIALFLWFWYNQFLEDQREKSQSQLTLECVQNTEIQIRSSFCNSTASPDYVIDFEVANLGSSKITQLIFNVKSDASSATNETGKVLEPGTSLGFRVTVSETDMDNEIPTQIEVIPAVSVGKVLKYCEDQSEISMIS